MLRSRIIPFLLLKRDYLVKTVNFKNERYIGDPLNAIRIFNEKKVDELVIADIDATKKKLGPNFELIRKISEQCFMPLCYVGGVKSIDDFKLLIQSGVEKVGLNSVIFENSEILSNASRIYGSQSVVVSIDLKKNKENKYEIFVKNGSVKINIDLFEFLVKCQKLGAGEFLFNFIDFDGTRLGYDYEFIEKIYKFLAVPSSFVGGASTIEDFKILTKFPNIGICAGTTFVLKGKFNAVLINYPNEEEKKKIFEKL